MSIVQENETYYCKTCYWIIRKGPKIDEFFAIIVDCATKPVVSTAKPADTLAKPIGSDTMSVVTPAKSADCIARSAVTPARPAEHATMSVFSAAEPIGGFTSVA